MKELFVPYELALQLKEIGFDELCMRFWTKDGKESLNPQHMGHMDFIRNSTAGERVSAPLYDQVIQWMIDKHQIYIEIHVASSQMDFTKGFNYYVWDSNTSEEYDSIPHNRPIGEYRYTTRYEALSAGIAKAIEVIKEKGVTK